MKDKLAPLTASTKMQKKAKKLYATTTKDMKAYNASRTGNKLTTSGAANKQRSTARILSGGGRGGKRMTANRLNP